jgi:hypothetical protein
MFRTQKYPRFLCSGILFLAEHYLQGGLRIAPLVVRSTFYTVDLAGLRVNTAYLCEGIPIVSGGYGEPGPLVSKTVEAMLEAGSWNVSMLQRDRYPHAATVIQC